MPEYNYVREVDYTSGVSFIIRKELWDDIGGFDECYSPAYYEDVDLAFEVRKREYKVLYQPKSIVVHAEDSCYGCDDNHDLINYKEINREKFNRKWADLWEEHFKNERNIFKARDRSDNKKTVLIVDHYVPQFDMDSGSLRMFNIINILKESGYQVIFWPDNKAYHQRYTWALQRIGVETLYGRINFRKYLESNKDRIDLIFLSRVSVAIKYIKLAKRLTDAPIIFDTVDLVFLREKRKALLEGRKLLEKEIKI